MDTQSTGNLLMMSTPETKSLELRSLQLSNGTITSIWNGSLFIEMTTNYTHSKKAITTGFAFKTSKTYTYRSDLKRKTPYTAYSNPRGFIYQNKDKKNKLMRIDELYKFSDGTLNDVRSALDDTLKNIRMKYLPQTIWREVDRERTGAMI
ncbi:hypothetical protein Tco_1390521 [Tanacetum coccineum]